MMREMKADLHCKGSVGVSRLHSKVGKESAQVVNAKCNVLIFEIRFSFRVVRGSQPNEHHDKYIVQWHILP